MTANDDRGLDGAMAMHFGHCTHFVVVQVADPAVWRRVNRPHPELGLDRILDGIARLASDYRGTLTTETMLLAGVNDAAESVGDVAGFLGRVAPAVAHLAVPTRPPAEALLLGRRFAIVRNLWCLMFAIAIAYLTVGTLRLVA